MHSPGEFVRYPGNSGPDICGSAAPPQAPHPTPSRCLGRYHAFRGDSWLASCESLGRHPDDNAINHAVTHF